MVDPNPLRGMPLALQRYWLAGKGALKIRWGLPHDFNRCVRALRKYFPANPEGLCNILHQKALGAPPGKGHPGEAALVAAAAELMARQPALGEHLWMSKLVPIGTPTGEPRRTRVFEPGSLSHRPLPLPFSWRKAAAQGHEGSVIVGRVLGILYGPDHDGREYAWGWGDYFDPSYVAEAREARYLADQGVLGCSIDPGGKVVVSINPANGWEYTSQYVIGGVTTVSIPAFTEMSVRNFTEEADWWNDDDPDLPMVAEGDCNCDPPKDMVTMPGVSTPTVYAVNPSGWHGVRLAPRETVFDNDDAVKRIAAWAGVGPEGADVNKLRQAFLWRDPQQPETQTTSYRMPIGDIINNELVMIYHAIYAAAALISGAHGGLPGVPDGDKNELRNTITDIYQVMAEEFNDQSVRAPWDRPENEGEQFAMADNAKKPYGDVAYADPGYQTDEKKRYPLDSEKHCRAAWSYINQAENAEKYTPEQLKLVRGRIIAALKKYGVNVTEESSEYSMEGSEFPVAPPAAWFDNPELTQRTPLVVTDEGQVYGHLALWGECHRDVTNRECVLAPRSQMAYIPFHLGAVITAEGAPVQVGKIVMDTRHADIRLGYASAALHYDDTGDEAAVVRAGEDEHGIWLAGAMVPEAGQHKVAKLRRSPLSGDWRAVNGHLELTAALAVNVPAFPVYAMEGEEQTALVAAGTLYPESGGYKIPYFGVDVDAPVVDMDALAAGVLERIRVEQHQDDRGWRLRELVEEDQQRRRELLESLHD